jgi:hypothetical protein
MATARGVSAEIRQLEGIEDGELEMGGVRFLARISFYSRKAYFAGMSRLDSFIAG